MGMAERGKTYRCWICDQEVLVTKAGPGTLICCAEEMKVVIPAQ
jgi:desulfoferrodoxin-like iron-binding protein